MLLFRWFLSSTVRRAIDLCRQVRKLTAAQRDVLPPETVEQLLAGVARLRETCATGDKKAIGQGIDGLEKTANRLLRQYPFPRWRENIEVLLVTGAVVLAIRTFIFQPMAIPSGSAQPTLFGITQSPDEWAMRQGGPRIDTQLVIPGALGRFVDKWWSGISYIHVVAKRSGALSHISQPRMILPFVQRQTFVVGGETYSVTYSSSFGNICERAALRPDMEFRAGDDIIKMRVTSGDHLFVNRVIYNFRKPRRGDIIVFETQDILKSLRPDGTRSIVADTHYIKRLVGLGGETVRIGNDRHLVIDGTRLDASAPGFENVYSFDPKLPPRPNHFSGHVNGHVGNQVGHPGLAVLFPDETTEFHVRPGFLLPMGDNTLNSADGRSWGDVPQEKVVGRSSFVFWPITERFGWGYR